jgi:hypothetical protein
MTKISNQYSLTNILTADLANSRLGINNVSPAYSLDLTGTARVSTSAYFATASGSVGIGTTSPSDILHILKSSTGNIDTYLDNPNITAGNGARFIFRTTDSTGANALNAGGIRTVFNSRGASTVDNDIIISTRGADNIIVAKNNGNVGIGTTSPDSKLNIVGGRSTFYANSESFAINVKYNSAAARGYWIGSPASGIMSFSNADGSERLRITDAGDVGIGTSSPGYKLQVSGTGYFSGALSSGSNISASGTLSSAALSTSQVLYAVNLTTFNYAGTLALTVPNALNSGSTLAEIRMYMIWATGFGDASHAGARIWLMIMNGNGTAYSAVELLGRDTDGGSGLSISRSAVNQITISSNGYGFIKSVSCMQLITN